MSKRNIILIVIILLIGAASFSYYYFYKPTNTTGGDSSPINFISEFFPFGKSTTTNTGETPAPTDISGYIPPEGPAEIPKELLTKISTMPIAGYGVFMKERFKEEIKTEPEPLTPVEEVPTTKKGEKKIIPVAPTTEFVPSLRYMERATGNIYQTFADKILEQKFTTTVIPSVYEANFGNNGESVAIRYLRENSSAQTNGNIIESFAGNIPKEVLGGDTSLSNELTGNFLPENITDISISPNKLSMFYLFNTQESAVGVTALVSGDKKNQIFSSPFTEWLSQWPNDRMITLTTKPSFIFPGFMYSLDPNTKKITKILGEINGLTTLTSPSGKLILYNNNNLALKLYNSDTNDSVSIGVKTMPEKCTWNQISTMLYCAVPKYVSGGKFPDTWYQGEISFSDDIWKINIESGSATKIADPISFNKGEDVDAIKLSTDEGENYLFFVNKKDSYLWELNLK